LIPFPEHRSAAIINQSADQDTPDDPSPTPSHRRSSLTPTPNPSRQSPLKVRDIQYITGDATAPHGSGHRIIAHICNDVGAWGKGFVVAISKRWPEPEADYRRWYSERDKRDFALGAVRLVHVDVDISVANMVAQRDIRRTSGSPPIRYDALRDCLRTLAGIADSRHASVHMPRIGCGLAGGEWNEIEPIIRSELSARDIQVTVYDFP